MARTKEEINKDYAKCCLTLGDLHAKSIVLARQIHAIEQAIDALQKEMQEVTNEKQDS